MQTERTPNLMKTAGGLLLTLLSLLLVNAASVPAQSLLYVLRDVGGAENQIYGFQVNDTTGALTALAGFPVGTGGTGGGNFANELLAIDAVNRRLYVINDGSNTISAYALNPATGALAPLPFSPISLGDGLWNAVAIHPSGSPLVVGDGFPGANRILSFQITAMTATAAAGSPYSTGSARPFSSAFSQDGNFVYTGGNTGSTFAGFSVNAATGVLTALAGSPFDSGADSPLAYVTDSVGRLLLANFFDGQVRAFTTTAGIPSAVNGNPFSSGLIRGAHGVLHPNSFYLVADRDSNQVGVYQIGGNGAATTLTAVAGSPFAAGGTFTNVLALNQSGAFLFAANSNSRNLTSFSVNPTTGALTTLGTQAADTFGTTGRITGLGYYANCVAHPVVTNDNDSGAGSLRQAIAEACAGSTITFNLPANSTITLTSGELLIDKSLTIQGPGANLLTISGDNIHKIFAVFSTSAVNLQLSGLTITKGFASIGTNAGAIEFISTGGMLYVTACALVNNGGHNPITAQIYSHQSGGITITDSTISGNPMGRGITIDKTPLTAINTTISGNAAFGIRAYSGTPTTAIALLNCTIASNGDSGVGFFVTQETSSLTMKNSIVANNVGLQINGGTGVTITSQGNNLCSDASLTPTAAGDLLNTNPRLAPLGNYGGPTPTHALLPGSPAINAGSSSGAPTTDQRGITRDANVDIGAFESRGFTLALAGGNNQTAAPTAPFANPLAVTVSNAFNEPVQGGQITFTPVPNGGASATLSGNPATLNNLGQASSSATANATLGSYQVSASANGLLPQLFNLSNACPTINAGTPTNGAFGVAYNGSVAATPAVSAPLTYRYTLANNTTLPAWLTLDANTGALTGTPQSVGTFSFDLRVELRNNGDPTGCEITQPRSLTIPCTNNPVVTNGNDSGAGSLREAIARACPGSTITFANNVTGTIALTTGQLVISKNLTINGPGAHLLTVNGGDFGIFQVAGTATFQLSGLKVTGGSGLGSALSVGGGTALVSNCEFDGNGGGALYSNNSLTMTNCLVSNSSQNGLSFGGTCNLTNTTFSNAGTRAIETSGAATLTLLNCTIANNGAGILLVARSGETHTVNLKNTILANNGGGQVRPGLFGGTVIINSQGNNLCSDASLTPTAAGDLSNTQPLLAPLGNYGGPTPTYALLPGSPAINAGTSSGAPTTDQRGVARPQNGAVDIGAVEASFALAATGGTPQSAVLGTAFPALLQATLTENGLPFSGAPVIFATPGSGASASFPNGATSTTDANGQAQVSALANFTTGSYLAQATVAGLPPVSFQLTNICPAITLTLAALPSGALGQAYPTQAFAATPSGTPYSFAVTQGQLPPGLTLNSNGMLSGTPTAPGNYAFAVTATSFGTCAGTRAYNLLITATCPTLTLGPASLNSGVTGSPFSATLTASGGTEPYTFAVTTGTLPTGLTLTGNGTLSGTPTVSGTFAFAVTATGLGGCTGNRVFTLVITCPSMSLTPTSLPGALAGQSYNQTITASPAGAYSYSLASGSLPPGLNLNAVTGALTGVATATGTYNFSLKAERGTGCAATRSYSVSVSCPTVAVNPASLVNGSVGAAYSQTLSATPSGNYSFVVSAGTLPGGLTLSTAGVLSGTPTTSGTFSFTVRATAFGACSGTRNFSLTIAAACPTITLPALPTTGKVGTAFFGDLSGTLPSGSYTFSVDSGALPPGLVLDNLFGALTGTPSASGTFNFTLKATSANGCSATRSYSVAITSGNAALAWQGDYDGDGQADFALWAAAEGFWRIQASTNETVSQTAWGGAGDVPVLGDYDGDGKTDRAVFRPSNGTFYVQRSSDGSYFVQAWGLSTDIPVPGDYDGDGKTDIAVWRGATGTWYVWRSSDQQAEFQVWGSAAAPFNDVPVTGDYDGDGKTDLAVFRRGTGTWFIKRSQDGQAIVKAWGMDSDVPVAADYNGDGQTDIAVWRGTTGQWFVWYATTQTYVIHTWGAAAKTEVPVVGDFDGDGRSDLALWQTALGNWAIRLSSTGSTLTRTQAQAGDLPVATLNRQRSAR